MATRERHLLGCEVWVFGFAHGFRVQGLGLEVWIFQSLGHGLCVEREGLRIVVGGGDRIHPFFLQERLSRGTVASTMRRAAHPSGCARCGAGAGCSAIEYQYFCRIVTL